jgi:hypothetical protein
MCRVADKYNILGENQNTTNSKEQSDVCVTKMAAFSYLQSYLSLLSIITHLFEAWNLT